MREPAQVTSSRRSAEAEGLLLAISPVPLALVASLGAATQPWALPVSAIASALLFTAGLLFANWVRAARLCALLGLFSGCIPIAGALLSSPHAALLAWVAIACIVFAIMRRAGAIRTTGTEERLRRRRDRSRWASASAFAFFLVMWMTDPPRSWITLGAPLLSIGFAAAMALQWAWAARRVEARPGRVWGAMCVAGAAPLFVAAAAVASWFHPAGIAFAAALFAIIPSRDPERAVGPWWDPLVTHPARLLLTIFFCLCTVGTVALLLPGTTTSGDIRFADALFTAVSASCVTGLIVLDTPADFTLFGQMCILMLIQLGGLGIMTISTVALHSLGRRLSLRQERMLVTLHGEHEISLVASLSRVLRVTFIAEALGAAVLLPQFMATGDSLPAAVWRAIFTSISAFCNAGFALQSDSLMPYEDRALILHVVAALIILGGMSPAIALTIVGRARGKRLDPAARVVLWMTALLLCAGTAAVLGFEWSRSLAGLEPVDRVHNAWFQSVTLRTAGFNSIEIPELSSSMLFVMILLMFIGGNPGGTAGGVKTTTVAVLGLAMWASVTGQREIVAHRRWLPSAIVYRAIAIVGAGIGMWSFTVLALLITQPLPERDLIFEATSALGTVGLSTGATPDLDNVGRAIIIAAMFLGRVGPLTLLLMLRSETVPARQRYPETRLPLT